MVGLSQKKTFQKKILDWYKKNKRDLPWRKTTDPYKILVSEVMLQQTQVDRVIGYYKRFLKKFPDLKSLAKGEKKELLSLWSGLGYNNRVLRLQKLAVVLTEEGKNNLPCDYEELLSLPGIGPYTAGAVMAFAFNKEVPVVDTNIRRVFIHELGLSEEVGDEELRELALELCPKGKARDWYNALMDYGAMEKTARKTGVRPTSRQSKFKGSNREIRGWVVKRVVDNGVVSLEELGEAFSDKEQVSRVLEKMKKEGLVVVEKGKIILRD